MATSKQNVPLSELKTLFNTTAFKAYQAYLLDMRRAVLEDMAACPSDVEIRRYQGEARLLKTLVSDDFREAFIEDKGIFTLEEK